MRLWPLLLALAAAGCATSTPPLVATPAPEARVDLPAPPPVRVVETPVVEELLPPEPPQAPRLRIDRRAVYPDAQATEWTLANGLVVVYVQGEAEGYTVRVDGPGGLANLPPALAADLAESGSARWGPLSAHVGLDRRVASGWADGIADALGAVRALFERSPDGTPHARAEDLAHPSLGPPPSRGPRSASIGDAFDRPEAFRVFLHGSAGADWVEAAVANELGAIRGRPPLALLEEARFDRRDTLAARGPAVTEAAVDAEWDDLAPARIVALALADRADVTLSLASGRLTVRAVGGHAPADLFAPLADTALRAARDAAEAEARQPAAVLAAFADLYAQPGQFRPARRPQDAARLADQIARTPPARVAALLRRLAATPDLAVLRHE
ncbi:hypothetical protein [Rubrivirga sp. IMCC43871]|uniref:hypothetical protein n=1 Tax=Rubrivirga sp. IMCC43871 TaxID=3391575 RepID=UPI00398F90EB